ncbi:MAG: Rrf2 family transcriptional regulator [Alphaproteobacteria bacterium]|nr:Rrf2 family transcriptional regulator [Alphaproteobacteria bacterium]
MNQIKLTTRGQYAVMVMLKLAKANHNQPIPLSDIADKSEISLSYLEQLVSGLRRHDLVKSHRGSGGGYVLSRHADKTIIADILLAAEDNTSVKRKSSNKQKVNNCEQTQRLWTYMEKQLYITLSDISLGNVLRGDLSF